MQENGIDVDSDVSGDGGGLEQEEFCVFRPLFAAQYCMRVRAVCDRCDTLPHYFQFRYTEPAQLLPHSSRMIAILMTNEERNSCGVAALSCILGASPFKYFT